MGKILEYTDLHFHRWAMFSEPDAEHINSRVARIRESVSWVVEQIREHKPGLVVMGGDLIHNTRSTDYAVFNQAYLALAEVSAACVEVGAKHVILSGNHDRLGRNDDEGVCLLPLAELPNTVLVDEETDICGHRFIPYTKDQLEPGDERITFCHTDIIENKIRGHALGKWSFKDIGSKLVVSGHYHTPCTFGKEGQEFVYVGSLLPHNFVDEGSHYCGILLIDDETLKW